MSVFKTICVSFCSHGIKETFNLFSSCTEPSKHSVTASRFLLSHMSCSKKASLRRGLFISAQVTLIKSSVRVGVLLRRFTSSHISSQRRVCGVTAEILINLETQMQLHRVHAQHACQSAGTACF